jgi:hypothetical protein
LANGLTMLGADLGRWGMARYLLVAREEPHIPHHFIRTFFFSSSF